MAYDQNTIRNVLSCWSFFNLMRCNTLTCAVAYFMRLHLVGCAGTHGEPGQIRPI